MESQIISRPGYEYRYKFRMDNELLSSYREEIHCSCACNGRSFILEVRTNFVLKPSSSSADAGEEIVDSERFATILSLFKDEAIRRMFEYWLPADAGEEIMDFERFGRFEPILRLFKDEAMVYLTTEYRLFEYWLPDNEILRIAHETLCFVKRMEADPLNAHLHVIPIVLGIDVCTVQFEGELIDATIDRLINPDCLIPFQVWGKSIVLGDGTRRRGFPMSEETLAMGISRREYLMYLPRERVEDASKGLVRMEECSICLKAPTFGAQITPLPCGHVFHNHCIVRWLMNSKTCPMCRFENRF